jgi:CheY-like chemotaxis protein
MSKRILVVEDQPDNRQIIRDMLAPTDYEMLSYPKENLIPFF